MLADAWVHSKSGKAVACQGLAPSFEQTNVNDPHQQGQHYLARSSSGSLSAVGSVDILYSFSQCSLALSVAKVVYPVISLVCFCIGKDDNMTV